MNRAELKQVDSHFEFGENWLDYLARVDEAAVAEAERGLAKLVPAETLRGARFLDIGSGSGLHTLAALRLGAREAVAIDIDPNSVAATKALIGTWAPGASVDARQLSIFDAEEAALGEFDIVYSWGVLHHTGAMWEAIERAGRFVRPGGLFVLALYQKTPLCGAWVAEKKFYTRAPELARKAIRGLYRTAFYAGLLATGRSPARYVRNYKSARGMAFHNDVHDWLGGYPYESASVEEVESRVGAMGFAPVARFPVRKRLGLLGTGCAEYVFRRPPSA